jgi:hypothetical protein
MIISWFGPLIIVTLIALTPPRIGMPHGGHWLVLESVGAGYHLSPIIALLSSCCIVIVCCIALLLFPSPCCCPFPHPHCPHRSLFPPCEQLLVAVVGGAMWWWLSSVVATVILALSVCIASFYVHMVCQRGVVCHCKPLET